MDVTLGRLFNTAVANSGKAVVNRTKHIKLEELANEHGEIVHFKVELFFYLSGITESNNDSSVSAVHHGSTPDYLNKMRVYDAMEKRDEKPSIKRLVRGPIATRQV